MHPKRHCLSLKQNEKDPQEVNWAKPSTELPCVWKCCITWLATRSMRICLKEIFVREYQKDPGNINTVRKVNIIKHYLTTAESHETKLNIFHPAVRG